MVQRIMFNNHTLDLHKETRLSVIVPIDQIKRQQPFSYNLIKSKACLDTGTRRSGGRLEVDCFVAYGYWDRLGPLQGQSVDIVQHFDKMMPQPSRKTIGAFTAMNGIQNDKNDFEKMCLSITARLNREKPLFIGIYNATTGKGLGIINDLERMFNEKTMNVLSFLFARQMFATFSTLLREDLSKFALGTHRT